MYRSAVHLLNGRRSETGNCAWDFMWLESIPLLKNGKETTPQRQTLRHMTVVLIYSIQFIYFIFSHSVLYVDSLAVFLSPRSQSTSPQYNNTIGFVTLLYYIIQCERNELCMCVCARTVLWASALEWQASSSQPRVHVRRAQFVEHVNGIAHPARQIQWKRK